MIRVGRIDGRRRLGHNRKKGTVLGKPDANREFEASRAAGELTASVLGDNLERACASADRPDQARPKSPTGWTVDDHPGCTVEHKPCACAEIDRLDVEFDSKMSGCKRPQLGSQQLSTPLAGRWSTSVTHLPDATEGADRECLRDQDPA